MDRGRRLPDPEWIEIVVHSVHRHSAIAIAPCCLACFSRHAPNPHVVGFGNRWYVAKNLLVVWAAEPVNQTDGGSNPSSVVSKAATLDRSPSARTPLPHEHPDGYRLHRSQRGRFYHAHVPSPSPVGKVVAYLCRNGRPQIEAGAGGALGQVPDQRAQGLPRLLPMCDIVQVGHTNMSTCPGSILE